MPAHARFIPYTCRTAAPATDEGAAPQKGQPFSGKGAQGRVPAEESERIDKFEARHNAKALLCYCLNMFWFAGHAGGSIPIPVASDEKHLCGSALAVGVAPVEPARPAFGTARVWHDQGLARPGFGTTRVWHDQGLARPGFGTTRVWQGRGAPCQTLARPVPLQSLRC